MLRVIWQRKLSGFLLYLGIKQYIEMVAVEMGRKKMDNRIILKEEMAGSGNTTVGDEGKVKD